MHFFLHIQPRIPPLRPLPADFGRDDNVYGMRALYVVQALCVSRRHCVSCRHPRCAGFDPHPHQKMQCHSERPTGAKNAENLRCMDAAMTCWILHCAALRSEGLLAGKIHCHSERVKRVEESAVLFFLHIQPRIPPLRPLPADFGRDDNVYGMRALCGVRA